MKGSVFKKIFAALLLVLLLLPILIILLNILRIDMFLFKRSSKSKIERTRELITKARTFGPEETLAGLGKNRFNGFYYRFDEHLNDAKCDRENIEDLDTSSHPKGLTFEFNGNDKVVLKPKRGRHALIDGQIRYQYIPGDYFENIEDVSINKDDIAEIVIRMKLRSGRMAQLGWSKDRSVKITDQSQIGVVSIYTAPDNKFHTYRINAKNALRWRLEFGDTIRKLFFIPSDVPGDDVTVDYIRFITTKEIYSGALYDETYHTINKEMRKGIYTHTPLSLSYGLDIPDEATFLRFGMGVFEENDPIKFRIYVRDNDLQEEAFAAEIDDSGNWHDGRVDLSKWKGKQVEIVFRAESEKENIAFWSAPVLHSAPRKRFNVIVLLEDALRADHLSCNGYFRKTTPVRDEFAKNGVVFSSAFSQATKTRPSCPTIMTSLYPTATGVWGFSDMLSDNYLTLPEILRSQGYATASFIQNDNAGPLAGLQQGFDVLLDAGALGMATEGIYSEQLYNWIDQQQERNFFLYLHLLDPHGPYDPPEPFDQWFKERSDKETPMKKSTLLDPEWSKTPTLEGRRLLYDGEINHNDAQLKIFLEELQERGILDNTLIIFISDHGEFLGEHDLWEHHPPGYRQALHVPMIMVYPKGLPADSIVSQPVQLVDVAPTILDVAEIESDGFLFQGDSLVELMRGENLGFWDNRICYSDEVSFRKKGDNNEWASIFYDNWHIINSNRLNDGFSLWKNRYGGRKYLNSFSIRVFDYRGDPEEETYGKSFLIDWLFQRRIKRFLRDYQRENTELWRIITGAKEETIQYDPKKMERLKALGYLD